MAARAFIPAAAILCLAAFTGCSPKLSPGEAFDAMAAAAEAGDEGAFLDGFAKESRGLMQVLLTDPQRRSRILPQFEHRVRSVHVELQPGGEMAMVVVETDSQPAERGHVIMMLEDGNWRLDLIATELLWNRTWALSGGRPRSFPDFIDVGVPGLDNDGAIR